MSKIPQKILNEINMQSLIHVAIEKEYHTDNTFHELPPELWTDTEKEVFDTLNALEQAWKNKVNDILTNYNNKKK